MEKGDILREYFKKKNIIKFLLFPLKIKLKTLLQKTFLPDTLEV